MCIDIYKLFGQSAHQHMYTGMVVREVLRKLLAIRSRRLTRGTCVQVDICAFLIDSPLDRITMFFRTMTSYRDRSNLQEDHHHSVTAKVRRLDQPTINLQISTSRFNRSPILSASSCRLTLYGERQPWKRIKGCTSASRHKVPPCSIPSRSTPARFGHIVS